MSFSYNLSASGTALAVARIRLDIGDVTSGSGVRVEGGNFSDEELLDFYGREGDSQAAASARACETLAREWARVASISAGPLREDYSKVSASYRALAQDFREQAGGGAALTGAGTFRRADGYAYRAGSVDYTL
jgi:hypothetical protein